MTRLCPAYAKDVLSFLKSEQLQKCRLVSRAMNATIINHPVSLPARRRLSSVEMTVGSVEEFDSPLVTSDGYAEIVSGDRYKSWPKVQAEWGCCREELEELAATLVGERILPAFPDDDLVRIWVGDGVDGSPSYRATVFCARNAMTAETAAGLLHLLDHMRGVYVDLLNILLPDDAVGEHSALNPALVQLLSDGAEPYRFHVRDLELLNAAQDVNKLIAGLQPIKFRRLHMYGDDDVDDVAAFEVAMQAKHLCESMAYHASMEITADAALEYFQRTVPQIGRDVVSKLSLLDDHQPTTWPVGLPPKEEMEVESSMSTDNGSRKVVYRLPSGMTNAHSGEHFDIELRCRYDAEEVEMLSVEMCLLFRR